MSQFIESIRIEDEEIFLLDLHQKRLNQTLSHFGVEGSIDIEKILLSAKDKDAKLFKNIIRL